MVHGKKRKETKETLVERLRRNPRRSCTLQSLLNGGGKPANRFLVNALREETKKGDESPSTNQPEAKVIDTGERREENDGMDENCFSSANILEHLTPKSAKKNLTPRSTSILTPKSLEGQRESGDLLLTIEQLRTENLVLRQQSKTLADEREKVLRIVKEKDALQASVQAQVAARESLQVHNQWLEMRYRQLVGQPSSRSDGSSEEDDKSKALIANLSERCSMATEEIAVMQDQLHLALAKAKSAVENEEALRQALFRSESIRRALHEQVMTNRGNMRVYCRVRPNSSESRASQGSGTNFCLLDGKAGDSCTKLQVRSSLEMSVDGSKTKQKSWEFQFDRIFHDKESQEHVFLEVQGLIQSALDGFNVCIFAYGQTGSGKTHTMTGDMENNPGICPRTLEQLFASAREISSSGGSVQFRLSILEIYNETLRDLLPQQQPKGGESKQSSKRSSKRAREKEKDKLQIRHDHFNGTTYVEGLSSIDLRDADHARCVIQQALSSRSVAKTKANDHSSRSHCVVTLHVERKDGPDAQPVASCIHLVDLAGSERLRHSGSDTDPQLLKEQCAINTSLTALKNTLRALASKQSHVPYRDSKLTYLLQNAWQSASCKTLMICTISQQPDHLQESLNSLRFAEMVLEKGI